MLNKKNIAVAMAAAIVAPIATPAIVSNADEVKKVVVSSGETEKIAKIRAELEKAKDFKYTNNYMAENSQGEYYREYTKYEKNEENGTDQDVNIYRVETVLEDGNEVITVTDRGHRVGFEGEWNAVVDFDEAGKNIPEKLIAEIVITEANNVPEYNVDAQLLFKSNGKYSEQGKKLAETIKANTIVKEETVADGNKTGKKLTIHGKNSMVVTIWGQPAKNTEDSVIGSLAGMDRCETAAQVSQQGWKDGEAGTVVLAGWTGTPDALAATPLASALNAPVLITEKGKVNPHTKAEIDRLQARNVIVVGGESHVSNDVIKELEAMGLNVKRIAGEDRMRTSFAIAKELDKITDVSDVFVAGGFNGEADALSIASHAGNIEQPILLVAKDHVADDVKTWMKNEDVTATMIGGAYAMDHNVQGEIAGATQRVVKRVEGANVQETNAAVINEFHKGSDALLIAQDNVLADALAAGPLAAKMDAPVVLGTNNITESQTQAIRSNVAVNVEAAAEKIFNVGHGVSRSVVRFIEDILIERN